MINGGSHFNDGLKTEQENQAEGFDIYGEPLFGHPYHPMEEPSTVEDEVGDEHQDSAKKSQRN
jgi:hypothetical protein